MPKVEICPHKFLCAAADYVAIPEKAFITYPLENFLYPKSKASTTMPRKSPRALISHQTNSLLREKVTFAIIKGVCKSACGAATFARRCLQQYAQKYHAPSRRYAV